jgi:NitT/TauT family transport system ATP-binding protein
MTEKIRASSVFKSFDNGKKVEVLEDVNFTVEAGEFVTLVGPTGCGKTTLLNILDGLLLPDSGKITIDGREVEGPGRDRGLVFQEHSLFPWRRVHENVEYGLEILGMSKEERRKKAHEYISLVGLDGFEDSYPYALSGGMKQRVAIARALAYDPEILLLDEPFAALDAQTRAVMQSELLDIWHKTKKTIVFVTHNIEEAVYLGDRVLVLTNRPSTVKDTVEVKIERPRLDYEVRLAPEFTGAMEEVWSLLKEEVKGVGQK